MTSNSTSTTSLLDKYERLLVNNLSAVNSIESALRNVTWLLPGRFEDAELASEALYALLNLVSGYHDSLLSRHLDPALSLPPHPFVGQASGSWSAARGPTMATMGGDEASTSTPTRITPLIPPASDHSRYTKYWTSRSSLYRKASRLLATLSYVQLLVEMVAKKRSERSRWKVVLVLEGFKTALKLLILNITQRPVLSPPTPQREVDLLSIPPSMLKKEPPPPSSTSPQSSTTTAHLTPGIPPHRAAVTALPPNAPLKSHLYNLTASLPEDHLPHPLTLLPELHSTGAWTAEIIDSSLGLIHVLLLIRAQKRQSYRSKSLPTVSSYLTPFAVPLALSLLARYLRPPAASFTGETSTSSLLLAEHYALQDRRLAMRTFLTGPMWVGWTRPKIERVVKALERVPVVGLAGELIEGYLTLVDDFYYYTAS